MKIKIKTLYPKLVVLYYAIAKYVADYYQEHSADLLSYCAFFVLIYAFLGLGEFFGDLKWRVGRENRLFIKRF